MSESWTDAFVRFALVALIVAPAPASAQVTRTGQPVVPPTVPVTWTALSPVPAELIVPEGSGIKVAPQTYFPWPIVALVLGRTSGGWQRWELVPATAFGHHKVFGTTPYPREVRIVTMPSPPGGAGGEASLVFELWPIGLIEGTVPSAGSGSLSRTPSQLTEGRTSRPASPTAEIPVPGIVIATPQMAGLQAAALRVAIIDQAGQTLRLRSGRSLGYAPEGQGMLVLYQDGQHARSWYASDVWVLLDARGAVSVLVRLGVLAKG